MDTISVIVPVYNGKKYIAKCIKSILKQTYPHWNLILVDDGSTDGSGEICDGFAERDSRISVVHQENRGLIKARMVGLTKATCEFIAFVDADDLVEPNMFQKLLDTQSKYSADIVCCGHKTLSRRGWIRKKRRKKYNEVTITSGKEEDVRMASALSHVSMWGKLYRKSVFTNALDMLETIPIVFWGEDSLINTAVFSKADKVVQIHDELYDYRIGGGSSGCTEKTMHELTELYQWRKNYLLSVDADMKYHKANLAQVLNAAIYYTHYSKKMLSRKRVCSELTYPIADIEPIIPNYRHKNAFDLSIPMTDKEFKKIYRESPLVIVKQMLLRIF